MSPNQAAPAPKTTIVLTGGGSGGHITPLLSLAHGLKRQQPTTELIYIGLKDDNLDGLKDDYQVFDKSFFISAGKFRRYHDESWLRRLIDIRTLALNLVDFFKVLAGVTQARRILKNAKPNLVFSKGGFVVVPVGIAARFLKIPIITHDSDAAAGLANRIVGRWAEVHTTGMPPKFYRYPSQSIKYVGIPVDRRVKPVTQTAQRSFKEELGLPLNDPVLLAAGGGLGSKRINDLILSVAPKLLQNTKTSILHITGRQHQDSVSEKYRLILKPEELNRVKVVGFTSEFYKYSGAADVIVARAGATTIAEFAIERKACILIPSPFLTGGHQLKNAKELDNEGAAIVLPEDVSDEALLKKIEQLIHSEKLRSQLESKISNLARPDAAAKLAEILLAEASKKKQAG